MAAMPLIIFDVNETPTFECIFRDLNAMRLWFANIMFRGADGGRLLRAVHQYWRGCHENVGGYPRQSCSRRSCNQSAGLSD
jgi:hypothetical protein